MAILDSGERTEFATGAVRDMHTGKGRMDLLPVTAIIELSKHCEEGALKYGERNIDKGIPQHSLIDSGLRHLFKYLRGDCDENHLRAALWNIAWAMEQHVNKPELNDLPWFFVDDASIDISRKAVEGSMDEPEPEERRCRTCAYHLTGKGACHICNNYSEWAARECKICKRMVDVNEILTDDPCHMCSDHSAFILAGTPKSWCNICKKSLEGTCPEGETCAFERRDDEQ